MSHRQKKTQETASKKPRKKEKVIPEMKNLKPTSRATLAITRNNERHTEQMKKAKRRMHAKSQGVKQNQKHQQGVTTRLKENQNSKPLKLQMMIIGAMHAKNRGVRLVRNDR